MAAKKTTAIKAVTSAVVAKPAAAKKTSVKKALAKKAPAKKAPAKKAPAKQAPAKQAPAKQAPAKQAPAKQSVTKQAPAKKAPAKKAPAKKAPAKKTASKAAPAKQTPAKKAATKRTATKRTATKKAATKKAATKKAATKKAATKKAATKRTATKRTAKTAVSVSGPRRGVSSLAVRAGEKPWTAKEVADVRAMLVSDQERLEEEISAAEEEIGHLLREGGEGAGHDQADVGSNTFERDHEMSMAKNAKDNLVLVKEAIGRIDDGSYGVCDSCGNPIGKMRLQAFPRATLCMECKQRQERR